ncbi:MAG: VTT domain-containing protein [Methanoregula sp.]|nr:VTT domain-containing protein [Methanoregula sp.]
MIFAPVDFILHIDTSLAHMSGELGLFIYVVLFFIIFCETGLVVFPFLPGDSLLFIAGALAGTGTLSLPLLLIVTACAAILGDTINFWIGRYAGTKIVNGRLSAFVKGEWIDKTRRFYEKYGGATIVIARFVPYVRTFAPFLAGVGEMRYTSFLMYNVLGGVLWTCGLILGGYFIGNMPIVQDHISLLMWLVLFLCIIALGMVAKTLISVALHK